jgi:hypothetical protein
MIDFISAMLYSHTDASGISQLSSIPIADLLGILSVSHAKRARIMEARLSW